MWGRRLLNKKTLHIVSKRGNPHNPFVSFPAHHPLRKENLTPTLKAGVWRVLEARPMRVGWVGRKTKGVR
jgi:hypothetical protein